MAGDTVLPLSTHQIQPQGKDRFFVKSVEKDRNLGFFDANLGQWIFPMSKAEFFKLGEKGDPIGNFMLQNSLFALLALLFLAEKCLAQTRGTFYDEASKKYGIVDPETGEPMTAPIFENAFFVENTDSFVYAKTAAGFGIFSTTGRVVVPPKFYSIYFNRVGAGASGFAEKRPCGSSV
jgi:WG containing repeat